MSVNTTVAVIDGIVRLRTGLAGHDLKDPALDPRYLTFDSGWRNGLRLLASGVVSGSSLSTGTDSFAVPISNTGTRTHRIIPVTGVSGAGTPAIAWMRAGSGSLTFYDAGALVADPGSSVSYQRAYRTCSMTLDTNELHVSPSSSAFDYVYLAFRTTAAGFEASGDNGARFGVHPLYGMGAFISRPGFNHLTCSLDDMMLSTHRNMVQVYETGIASPVLYGGGGARWSSDRVSGEPFPSSGTTSVCALVTLNGSYPDYPPVVAYRTGTGYFTRLTAIYWLSANELLFSGLDSDDDVRFAVLATDPSYQGGTDNPSIAVRRIRFVNGSLDVTKHDVDWAAASESQFIFRSSRQAMRFNGFTAFPTTFPSGDYALPTPAPSGAGPPFTFFLANEPYAGWWCGLGHIDMQDIAGSSAPFDTYFRGAVISRTQYHWFKEPTIAITPTGWTTTMNVSDFG